MPFVQPLSLTKIDNLKKNYATVPCIMLCFYFTPCLQRSISRKESSMSIGRHVKCGLLPSTLYYHNMIMVDLNHLVVM